MAGTREACFERFIKGINLSKKMSDHQNVKKGSIVEDYRLHRFKGMDLSRASFFPPCLAIIIIEVWRKIDFFPYRIHILRQDVPVPMHSI